MLSYIGYAFLRHTGRNIVAAREAYRKNKTQHVTSTDINILNLSYLLNNFTIYTNKLSLTPHYHYVSTDIAFGRQYSFGFCWSDCFDYLLPVSFSNREDDHFMIVLRIARI
jgi:hypothetical protein